MKYIIENLEPRLFKWSLIEYTHISKLVNKKNLIFTNVRTDFQKDKLKSIGKTYRESFKELNLKKICILDQSAPNVLTAEDCKNLDFLIFGGILGDYPRKRRTSKLKTKNALYRNLGKKQMPTDNAVYAAKLISKGISLSKIKFKDKVEIHVNKHSSIILPFRYILSGNNPIISKDLLAFIKKKGF